MFANPSTLRRVLSRCTAFGGGIIAMVALSACVVDPSELADSSLATGSSYRGGGNTAPMLPAGRWWDCFGDPVLNGFIARLDAENPSLAAALARYDRARAELGLAKADQSPSVSGDLVWKRKRDSASGVFVPPNLNYSDYRAALNLNYEIDLWGRVRQSVNAARANAEAASADYSAARLSLRAELAKTYFQLRYIDAEIGVLKKSLDLREEARTLVSARVRGGETTDLDLALAETELEATRAQMLQLERSRAGYFNALAILCGEAPASFSMPPGGVKGTPAIPTGLPSELLTRRPDIAAADLRMQAAAARIGAVKASYLPRINLAATGGVSSLELADLFSPSSLFGEIGPDIQVPIYQAGRAGIDMKRAYADSDEAVALYKETSLRAFREVEDALSGMRFLDREIEAHRKASDAAERASRLSQKRYEGGLTAYMEVVDAQRSALNEERGLVQARSARLITTVQLVQALGGGWEAVNDVNP